MFPSREAPGHPAVCVLVLRRALRPLLRSALPALACALMIAPLAGAHAKTPGGVHCYGKTCHRVSSLEEMDGSVGRFGILKASFYDDCRIDRFNTCGLTSSGEEFRPGTADNAASPVFPDGTVLLAFNPETRKAAVLRVNSAGPYWGDRKLDVSRAAAEKLGFRDKGVADLMVAIIRSPGSQEARYKNRRRYAPVAGYIGVFPSFEAAHEAALASLSLAFQAGSRQEASFQRQFRLAAIEPEPELPTISRHRADVQPRPSRQEIRQHTIIYLDPVSPEELPLAGTRPQSVETIYARHVEPDADAGEPAVVETLERGHSGERQELVTHLEAPVVVVTAHEPAYWALGLGLKFNISGFWHRLMVFVAEARRQARPRGAPFVLPAVAQWRPRLEAFVHEARAKARVGVTRSGPLYELFADLKLKAQAVRD